MLQARYQRRRWMDLGVARRKDLLGSE